MKIHNQTLLSRSLKPIDTIFIAFSILNIVNVLLELFFENHLMNIKNKTASGMALRKYKSPYKEI